MKHFADDLNRLAISKWMKTVVIPQEGYVPPPLVGIWARYPYLHNNSIPTLCDLLTPAAKRTKKFYQGTSIDPKTDFDPACVGFLWAIKRQKNGASNRRPNRYKTKRASKHRS